MRARARSQSNPARLRLSASSRLNRVRDPVSLSKLNSLMMTEMGDIVGNGTVTEQTCTKLDALMVRAKKL